MTQFEISEIVRVAGNVAENGLRMSFRPGRGTSASFEIQSRGPGWSHLKTCNTISEVKIWLEGYVDGKKAPR